jgi:hypothetical protein
MMLIVNDLYRHQRVENNETSFLVRILPARVEIVNKTMHELVVK